MFFVLVQKIAIRTSAPLEDGLLTSVRLFSYFAPQKFVSGFLFLFIHLFIFCKPREQNIKRLLG